MKKIITTSLISMIASSIACAFVVIMALSSNAFAVSNAIDDYGKTEYNYYLGVGVGFDMNNTKTLGHPAFTYKETNKHSIVPQAFFGYNVNNISSVELQISDNNYTNTNALNTVESHGYNTTLAFHGIYPLSYDGKCKAYGEVGIGGTYWNTSLNDDDSKGHMNVSGMIGIGVSYNLIDEVMLSAGYNFSYLGQISNESYLAPKKVTRHQLELKLQFNL